MQEIWPTVGEENFWRSLLIRIYFCGYRATTRCMGGTPLPYSLTFLAAFGRETTMTTETLTDEVEKKQAPRLIFPPELGIRGNLLMLIMLIALTASLTVF